MGDSSNAGCFLIVALALGIFAWNKIDNLEKQRETLKTRVETLQSNLDDVKEKASALETSSDALKTQMERFSSEDWADVLPDAREASDQVASDQDDLKQAVETDGDE